MSLALLGAVELLFCWGILDVFWGYGVFFKKILSRNSRILG
ncbi:hypothetical protein [Campylobacter sp.]|nr:hypothetical protein [Campylobacter sp.]